MSRSERIELRLSPEEKARLLVLARAAGVTAAEWVRLRALDGTVVEDPGEPPSVYVEGGPVDVSDAPVAETQKPFDIRRAPDRGLQAPVVAKRFHCPVAGCSFGAGSAKARCPRHGRTVEA